MGKDEGWRVIYKEHFARKERGQLGLTGVCSWRWQAGFSIAAVVAYTWNNRWVELVGRLRLKLLKYGV